MNKSEMEIKHNERQVIIMFEPPHRRDVSIRVTNAKGKIVLLLGYKNPFLLFFAFTEL